MDDFFYFFFILVFHILKVKFDPLLYFSSRNRKSERYLSIARQSWTGQEAVKVLLTTCLAAPVSSHPFPISSSTSSLNKTCLPVPVAVQFQHFYFKTWTDRIE